MTERCPNCGAELFEGQQFCRRCGAAVRPAGEDAPTQLFPQGEPTSGVQGATTHFGGGGRGTDPVQDPRQTAYQPYPSAYQPTSPLATAQAAPRRGRRLLWLFAALGLVTLASLGALAFVLFQKARQPVIVVKKTEGWKGGVVPPVPPDLPERVRAAVEGAGVPLPLEEEGATVTASETVITRSFDLEEGATFSLKSVKGDVKISAWDEPRAEVKVVKRGGSPQQRAAVRLLLAQREEGLFLMTAAPPVGPVSVYYEVSLPRSLSHVEINSDSGDVSVSGLDGTVVLDARTGDVEFRDVAGVVRSNLIKGNTRVVYARPSREGPQEFKVVRGNVEVDFADEPAADIKAEATDGDIRVADGLGLRPEKSPAGLHAAGRVGAGGEPVFVQVVKGDISLKN